MSVMSLIDLQCQQAMSAVELTLDHMGFCEDDLIPALVLVEVTQQAAFAFTPIDGWEMTLPYMLNWAYERFEVKTPTLN